MLAVLAYHGGGSTARWSWAKGGFLGVDVFFVLSGFLITSLLLIDHRERGTTLSARFWARRARRLLPAFLVLVVLVSLYALVAAPRWQLTSIRNNGIAALLYVENWYTIHSGDLATPFSHTWSLSIEEQWYLLWPVLLLGLIVVARGSQVRLALVTGLLAALSLVAMAWAWQSAGWVRAYYGTDTRAYALLIGAVLAVVTLGRGPIGSRAAAWAAEAGGIVGLVVVAWMVTAARPVDGWLYPVGSLMVALSAAAVVFAATQPTSPVVRRALGWRPLVAVGLISYGLYLYHLPINRWLAEEHIGVHGAALDGLRVGAAFALATGSYFLVEMPIRRGALGTRTLVVATPLAFAGALAVLVIATVGGVARPPVDIRADRYAELGRQAPAGSDRVLVAGEGMAFDLADRLGEGYEDPETRGLAVSVPPCTVFEGRIAIGDVVHEPARCPGWRQDFVNAVDGFDPDVSVLMAGGQAGFDREVGGAILRAGTPELARSLTRDLERVRGLLSARGAELVLLTVPCAPTAPAPVAPEIAAVQRDSERNAWVSSVWRDFAATRPDVHLVDIRDLLCAGDTPRRTVDGVTLRGPDARLTPEGARVVWQWIARQSRPYARA